MYIVQCTCDHLILIDKVRHPPAGDHSDLLHHAGSRLAGHTGQGSTFLTHLPTCMLSQSFSCSLCLPHVLHAQVPFCSSHGALLDTPNIPGLGLDKITSGESVQVHCCVSVQIRCHKTILTQVDCAVVVGYQAVYRLCLIVTLFFTLMSLLMIGVKSSNDPRAGIQNGFWGFK